MSSILCREKFPFLRDMRKELIFNCALKTATNPNNPVYDLVFSKNFANEFNKKVTVPKEFNIRIKNIFNGIEFRNR